MWEKAESSLPGLWPFCDSLERGLPLLAQITSKFFLEEKMLILHNDEGEKPEYF